MILLFLSAKKQISCRQREIHRLVKYRKYVEIFLFFFPQANQKKKTEKRITTTKHNHNNQQRQYMAKIKHIFRYYYCCNTNWLYQSPYIIIFLHLSSIKAFHYDGVLSRMSRTMCIMTN